MSKIIGIDLGTTNSCVAVISCPGGLEPRPIAELVQIASKFESKIYLETETKRVNAKSIMGMMSLNLANGDLPLRDGRI